MLDLGRHGAQACGLMDGLMFRYGFSTSQAGAFLEAGTFVGDGDGLQHESEGAKEVQGI